MKPIMILLTFCVSTKSLRHCVGMGAGARVTGLAEVQVHLGPWKCSVRFFREYVGRTPSKLLGCHCDNQVRASSHTLACRSLVLTACHGAAAVSCCAGICVLTGPETSNSSSQDQYVIKSDSSLPLSAPKPQALKDSMAPSTLPTILNAHIHVYTHVCTYVHMCRYLDSFG